MVMDGGWAALIVLRLFHLQVISYEDYKGIAQSQQERVVSVAARRGKILDRNNQELAMKHIGHEVTVSGDVTEDSIKVSGIEESKPATK